MNGHTQGQRELERAWWSFDLGRFRPCNGAYCRYEYDWDNLPSLTTVSESLDWLEPLDANTDAMMQIHRNPAAARGEVAKIAESAARLGLTLPESFVRLMSDPALQDRIPSCTACYFKLSDDILPYPGSDGGSIVRFYNDQQGVLFWYLYFPPEGGHRVLVTTNDPDEMANNARAGKLSDEDRRSIRRETWICAPSFVAFVYRWWLENSIWFKVSESQREHDLTPAERAYLAHYDPSIGTQQGQPGH